MGLLVTVAAANVARFDEASEEELAHLMADNRVWGVAPVALGQQDVSDELQEQVFVALVKASIAANKAVVLESGSCAARQLELLQQLEVDFNRVALLNNTLDEEAQKPWLEAGCAIAFDGFVTYAENDWLRAAARAVPLEQLLSASNQPAVTPKEIAAVPGGTEDVVWTVGELVELKQAFGREAFMAVYDALHENAMNVLALSRPAW